MQLQGRVALNCCMVSVVFSHPCPVQCSRFDGLPEGVVAQPASSTAWWWTAQQHASTGPTRMLGLQAALEASQTEAACAEETLASLTAQVGAKLAADEQVSQITAQDHALAWLESEQQVSGLSIPLQGQSAAGDPGYEN